MLASLFPTSGLALEFEILFFFSILCDECIINLMCKRLGSYTVLLATYLMLSYLSNSFIAMYIASFIKCELLAVLEL
jgi:hypothetical protein